MHVKREHYRNSVALCLVQPGGGGDDDDGADAWLTYESMQLGGGDGILLPTSNNKQPTASRPLYCHSAIEYSSIASNVT